MEQGRLAACHMFGTPYEHMPVFVPYGIYTIPEMANKTPMLKLLFDPETHKLLGVHALATARDGNHPYWPSPTLLCRVGGICP
jgi:pyruvate/2-oxoglutarate dehydrogenase complex dihydrolipoamide dehydrogenase (E3) component